MNEDSGISASLYLLSSDEGGPAFTIRSGFRSGLIHFGEEHGEYAALGCALELVDSEELAAGERAEVVLKPWAAPESWRERVVPGSSYDYWHGKKIGELHVRGVS